jgi:hypothetical protein
MILLWMSQADKGGLQFEMEPGQSPRILVQV